MRFQRCQHSFAPRGPGVHPPAPRYLLSTLLLTLGLFNCWLATAQQAQTSGSSSPSSPSATTGPSTPATRGDAKTAPPSRIIHFEVLETTDNRVYQQVTVRKAEPDSLLIEHLSGIVRVSLFDLSEEIQTRYHFDRDAAIEHYKRREAEQRAMRKQLLLERVRQQAIEEGETRQQNLERLAKAEWIPVRAKILAVDKGNALAIVDRIVMKPTRTKTALGGEGLPGPPKKVFVRMSKSPVWLKEVGDLRHASKDGRARYWHGYIWPDGEVILNPKEPDKTTAAYRTIVPKD